MANVYDTESRVFERRFQGTYFNVQLTNYLEKDTKKIANPNDIITVRMVDRIEHLGILAEINTKGKIVRVSLKESEFNILPCPKKKIIKCNSGIMSFKRMSRRQYQRGLNESNAQLNKLLSVPSILLSSKIKDHTIRSDDKYSDSWASLAWEIFKPSENLTLEQGIKDLEDNSLLFRILNDRLFIVRDLIEENAYNLFLEHTHIAKISDRDISPIAPFHQEVSDLLNRSHSNFNLT